MHVNWSRLCNFAQFVGHCQDIVNAVAVGCEYFGIDADGGKEGAADRGLHGESVAGEAECRVAGPDVLLDLVGIGAVVDPAAERRSEAQYRSVEDDLYLFERIFSADQFWKADDDAVVEDLGGKVAVAVEGEGDFDGVDYDGSQGGGAGMGEDLQAVETEIAFAERRSNHISEGLRCKGVDLGGPDFTDDLAGGWSFTKMQAQLVEAGGGFEGAE